MSTGRPDDPRPVDDAVDQAWRAASNEVPGSRIDAAILEAARAEADRDLRRPADAGGTAAPRRRNWWTAWQPLAAAATVAGLAFVLVQTMPRDRDVAPPIAVEQAAPEVATTTAPVPPPPAADTTAAPLDAVADSAGAPPAGPDAEPAAEPAAAASAESRDEQPMRSRAAAPASAPAPAPAAAPAGVAAQAGRELGESQRAMESTPSAITPEAWSARVEELFVAGDQAAAAAALRAFRAAHADADRYLPDDLRDWAGTVE